MKNYDVLTIYFCPGFFVVVSHCMQREKFKCLATFLFLFVATSLEKFLPNIFLIREELVSFLLCTSLTF